MAYSGGRVVTDWAYRECLSAAELSEADVEANVEVAADGGGGGGAGDIGSRMYSPPGPVAAAAAAAFSAANVLCITSTKKLVCIRVYDLCARGDA